MLTANCDARLVFPSRLMALVDGRMRDGLPLIVTMNLLVDSIREKLGEPLDGPLYSRLTGTHSGVVRVVAMKASDYRVHGR